MTKRMATTTLVVMIFYLASVQAGTITESVHDCWKLVFTRKIMSKQVEFLYSDKPDPFYSAGFAQFINIEVPKYDPILVLTEEDSETT